jgi:large subunit ribosomal protein L4
MSAVQATLFSRTGEAKGKTDLPESLVGGSGSRRVLHEAIVALRRNQRRGTSNTLTRGEVTGGGRKPWKQKGTGNARSGSIRSPLWRKGGIIFGPHPRSYRVNLSHAKRLLALQTALYEKSQAAEVSVVEAIGFKKGKTGEAASLFKALGFFGRVLVVLDKREADTIRAIQNLRNVQVIDAAQINANDVLSAHQVLFTPASLEMLTSRFSKN